MAKFVDELLLKLGLDATQLKQGFTQAAKASKDFVTNIEDHQKQITKLTLGGAVAFTAQAAFIRDVTNEFAAQETAVNKLNTLLKSEQRTRADSVDILVKQADALQKITPFADESIISLQATAAAFGLTDTQIEQITPHILDVAAGFRDVEGNALDLDTVMRAVGKAVNGNGQALQKLGIDAKLTGDKAHDLETVMSLLQTRFGGAAEAAGTTFAGKMTIAKNQIGEVKEAIGAALAPAILDLTDKLLPVIQRFGEWTQAHRGVVLAIVGGGIAGAGLISALGSLGLAIAAFGAGPVGLAVIGVSALVGWLVKLKLTSDTKLGDMGIDELNAKLVEAQDQVQKLIEYRDKLAQPGPGLNKEQIVSIFQFGSVDKALDEADKRIAESKAYIDTLYASLAKTPKLELETRLEDANKELASLQTKITDIKSGGTSIQSIGVLDGLEIQAREVKQLVDALKKAIESIPEIEGPTIPDAIAAQRTPNAEEDRARRLTLANTVADERKATQEWYAAKLAMLEDEFAKEKAAADEAGKDTVALEVKYYKQREQALTEHLAAMRARNVQQLDSQQADRKSGRDQFVGPTTPNEDLVNTVNARAGIKVTPDPNDVERDWDEIVSITDEKLEEMQTGLTGVQETAAEVLAGAGESMGLAVGSVIAGMGEMFGAFITQGENVANALGKTIVVSTIEALKAVVRAWGEAEIGKAVMSGFLSFGATLAFVGPIAAKVAAVTGILSGLEASFVKKNSGRGFELGGIVPSTDHFLMHEGEVVYNPKRNSDRELAANLASVGKQDLASAITGRANRGVTQDIRFNFTNWGGIKSDVDLNRAMDRLASNFMAFIPQGT